MSGKIIVIGSLNMDLVVYTQRFPHIGETIFGSRYSTFCGGKGANQAVAMARLGADVQMIGKIGRDEFGQKLLDNLETTMSILTRSWKLIPIPEQRSSPWMSRVGTRLLWFPVQIVN